MSETGVQSAHIQERAVKNLRDAHLQAAYRAATLRLYTHRLESIGEVPGFERLRERARILKREVIEHLDEYLSQFADEAERRGCNVHWAADAQEVCNIVRQIAQAAGVKEFVKSKTMVGEEVELNRILQSAGIRAIETDLGELIIQLAGERPAHITAPAFHKTRQDVADLFFEHLHSERATDPERLTLIARNALREAFAHAGLGLTGANFAVAETGTVVLIENEGNIRLCTTSPQVHVILVGIEKIIPRFADLAVFLRLLVRSAGGEKLSAYTSLLSGPRRLGEDGPEAMHVIMIDNGRTKALADELMRESLYCIRCGACLNACPVYRKIGGHAYGWVYSGPIGALVTPGYNGIEKAPELPFASSLCGACREVCPVQINIPDLLLHLRAKAQTSVSHGAPPSERYSIRIWAWTMQRPWAYRLACMLVRLAQRLYAHHGWIRRVPFYPMTRWIEGRDFPALAPKPFRKLFQSTLKTSHQSD